MRSMERHGDWEKVYQTEGENEVSWFQEIPTTSLELIHATGVGSDASIIDIGGGASRLVDALLDEGFAASTVLDLSEKALETSRARLGTRGAANVVAADVTKWEPLQT
jgi:ubiquinone/menaquinone biosynthesis C-methylase UbiE